MTDFDEAEVTKTIDSISILENGTLEIACREKEFAQIMGD